MSASYRPQPQVPPPRADSSPPRRPLSNRAAFALLAASSIGVALYAWIAYGAFPAGSTVHPDMRPAFQQNAPWIVVHAFAAAAALLLGPFQFWRRLRSRRPDVHRWLGRIYLGVGVGVGGISGLVIAQQAYGGAVARIGFTALAIAWLASGWLAYAAIRRGDVAAHRRWMVRNFAMTFAAVTLRIYLPVLLALGIEFHVAYAAVAWLCWLPSLLVVEPFVRDPTRTAFETRGVQPL